MTVQPTQSILIVDFGSQVTQLIARRVREAGVYCEIAPFNAAEEAFERLQPKGVIFSGGPASVTEDSSPRAPQIMFDSGVPLLAICYGQQTLHQQLGGKVVTSDQKEFGRAFIEIVAPSALFDGLWNVGEKHQVWMSHGDRVETLAPGFEVVAASEGAPFAIATNEEAKRYSLMFHPEVVHTPDGGKLLANFVRHVCGCAGDWTMASFRDAKIADIREQVGTGKVICGLSGGVDSAVAAVLIHEAIGEQLTCVFVDHGLMRQGEAEQVVSLFRNSYNIPLVHVDASRDFLDGLEGVTRPRGQAQVHRRGVHQRVRGRGEEDRRRRLPRPGHALSRRDRERQLHRRPVGDDQEPPQCRRPARADEHAAGRAAARTVQGRGARARPRARPPEAFVARHPFPGPGLAIRIPGEVTHEKCDILRKADAVYLEEIRNAGLYDAIWQAFAVLLPVRTVGVMGDYRTYDYVCGLRAVTSVDGMTADVYPFDAAFLSRVATRIVNEVQGINRVVYDYTSKPPGTIEWE